MSNKMLIDASHPEETRVVVLRGNRVEEFDFEAADRQQLRGNIYLAKVTRVEPSLQAAFVDYGGNRHGFLAFSEIHPDYYQIPVADRQALLEEQAKEAAEEAEAEAEADRAAEARRGGDDSRSDDSSDEDNENGDDDTDASEADQDDGGEHGRGDLSVVDEKDNVENVGAEDALEEVPERRSKPRPRQYKIQEVIKRRQVLLVQVVKEERGNKGAALTTYLSLAGRYSVLMPNTARGGGISRKITNAADRKRLKSIASELDVPEGMGVILRTAGANRTKTEVKRDFEYLLRLWENVRELTLRSTAPTLVYEEGSLIKRSIRDLYSKEIEQVVVAGDDAYREAKDFMRMLMPSHAKNVQAYRDDTPIFAKTSVETQLDAMFSPQVTLKSGGYIVINQTEALVSIDVNSGRSTREHSIEDTALNTNLEASEEISRQLRLRDLAGLIVIDFIDMEEKRNNRAVEKKLKDCLRFDRARIQVGRISHFGLMEMSRQRMRTGVLESSVIACPHCRGTGQVRSISSLSLQILRALESYLLKHASHDVIVRTRPEVALYLLNQKRAHLAQLEQRFGLCVQISMETPADGAGYQIERGDPVAERPQTSTPISVSNVRPELEAEVIEDEEDEDEGQEVEDNGREVEEIRDEQDASPRGERKSRRRRRRRGGNRDDQEQRASESDSSDDDGDSTGDDSSGDDTNEARADDDSGQEGRRRRRGRRGGRRRGRGRDTNGEGDQQSPEGDEMVAADAGGARPDQGEALVPSEEVENKAIDTYAPANENARDDLTAEPAAAESDGAPAAEEPSGDGRAEEVAALTEATGGHEVWQTRGESGPESEPEPVAEPMVAEAEAESQVTAEPEPEPQPEPQAESQPEPEPEPEEDDRPKKTGWWSRRSFF